MARSTYQPHQSFPRKLLHGAVMSQLFGLGIHIWHVSGGFLLSRGLAKMLVTSARRKRREALKNMLGV